MIGPLLALSLAAGPAPLPSVDGAQATILVARLDRMGRMVSFLERAGRYSVILRPGSWVSELHPLLSFDPSRPDSISAAGIDPTSGIAISLFNDNRVTCVSVSDPAKYEPQAQARLSQLGAVGRAKDAGASVVVAAVKGHAVAGYVLRGKLSCATEGPGAEDLLRRAAKSLAKPPKKAPWDSAAAAEDSAYFVSPQLTLQLTGKLDTMEVRGRSSPAVSTGGPMLKPAGASPYGGVPPSGLALVRARVSPDGVRRVLGQAGATILAACEVCNPDVVGSLIGAVRNELTGEVMLRVDRVKAPPGSLRSLQARYFAIKHAYLAEVAHPEVVSAALEGLMKIGAVRTAKDTYSLKTGTSETAGTVLAGLSGKNLYLANDDGALQAALTAAGTARAAPLEHSADVFVDPHLVARAFGQVSLLDLMSSRDLAPIVAAGTELVPLLNHSQVLTAWVDADGTAAQRLGVTWKLDPGTAPEEPAAPDAGR